MSTASDNQARGLAATGDTDPARSPWLCVAGAKGGVGKTVLATNLALQFARAGYRTLLVDFDPGTGNVGVQLRIAGEFDLDDVAAGRCSAARAIVQGPGRLNVLLGRSGPTELTVDPTRGGGELLQQLRIASRAYDVTVFDTGAGLHAPTLEMAALSDVTLGVATPEVTALTDAYALCKALHLRGTALPRLVVNRARSRDEAMATAGKLSTVTRKFLGVPSELCGFVRNDREVEDSTRRQRPLTLFGEGQVLEDLRSIAANALAALPPLRRAARPAPAPTPARIRLRPAAS